MSTVCYKQQLDFWKAMNYAGGLKSSYEDIIPAGDEFFDQQHPSTGTLIKEMYGL